MTPRFFWTRWCCIDGARRGHCGSGQSLLRLAILPTLLPLVPAGCVAQDPPSAERSEGTVAVELIRHENGQARAIPLAPACETRIPELAAELMAGAEPVRLLVDGARIREVKNGGALEVVFGEPQQFSTAGRLTTRARRLLLPLNDPYWVGTEDRPFAVVFVGEEEYGTGPYRNDRGLPLLRELEACAGGA